MTDELSRFKREINLAEFASTYGFEIDKVKSCKRNTVMRAGDAKITVFRGLGGDPMYHDLRSGKSGSVIDFCQHKTGRTLGHVRKELRSYLGSPHPQVQIAPPRPKPTREEQEEELAIEKAKLGPLKNLKYLENRRIDLDTLTDQRFVGVVLADDRGNVCFPHNNGLGFSGAEKKNVGFTGFSRDGEKGLWFSNAPAEFDKIIICESGIDALSHARLHPHNKAAYVSIGGQMSHTQEQQLVDLIQRNQGKLIVGAFDNDEAGKRYADDLARICKAAGGRIEVSLPRRQGQDWNDVLKKTPEKTIKARWKNPEKAQEPLERPRRQRMGIGR